ncbi:MAG: hypothetical protein RIG61_01455 [Deltaproteobacteria bacterium]
MNIHKFDLLYGSAIKNSERIFEHWDNEKRVDELLNTPIAPGVVLFDVLHGDQILDQIKPELKEAFTALMKDKADTYEEIRALIYEKIELGDNSIEGFINKIVGQVGENRFIDEAEKIGLDARLAESGSQKGWDAVLPTSEGTKEYVQVKLYSEPSSVIREIKEVNDKLQLGEITDGDQIVNSIDFAVPEDIHEEVVEMVNELDLETKIYKIDITSSEARDMTELGFGFSANASEALENFFTEIIGSSITAASLHVLANAFLMYKGAKNSEQFIHDTLEQTAISSGAISTGMAVELMLTNIARIGGLPSYVLVLGTTITIRQILKRIANRQSYVDWLENQNLKLHQSMLAMSNY